MLRFKLIPREDITSVAPLVALLNEGVSLETIKNRLLEMCDQNYECVGVFVLGQSRVNESVVRMDACCVVVVIA